MEWGLELGMVWIEGREIVEAQKVSQAAGVGIAFLMVVLGIAFVVEAGVGIVCQEAEVEQRLVRIAKGQEGTTWRGAGMADPVSVGVVRMVERQEGEVR